MGVAKMCGKQEKGV